MNLHADYSQRIVLNHHALTWQLSPEPGVERKMLDRIGDEVAKATSIVRYAAGAEFARHTTILAKKYWFLMVSSVMRPATTQQEHT